MSEALCTSASPGGFRCFSPSTESTHSCPARSLELLPNLGDVHLGQDGGFSLRRACLDAIFEFHIGDEFWQHVLSVEAAPRFLCALDELEHHGERGLVRQAALRADRSMTDGRERAFDGICGP